jgi:hypothetical protein
LFPRFTTHRVLPLISATGPAIQRDWDNRDFTQGIQLNILKIVQFLNKFGEWDFGAPVWVLHGRGFVEVCLFGWR